ENDIGEELSKTADEEDEKRRPEALEQNRVRRRVPSGIDPTEPLEELAVASHLVVTARAGEDQGVHRAENRAEDRRRQKPCSRFSGHPTDRFQRHPRRGG